MEWQKIKVDWQPIATGPKDGHRALLTGLFEGVRWTAIGHWSGLAGVWATDSSMPLRNEVTHWQPLPEPPDA